MQELIGNVKLNYQFYSGSDEYSDGDIEDELLEIVKNNETKEFNHIIADRKNWAVLYHLSEIRNNILGVIDFCGDESVLEIGSGCGAITGKLAASAKTVTCIDLSKKRSLINAYRNKEKDNIEILVGNFETIEKGLEEKYDIITLIGVFEYAQYYISSNNPYGDFLQMVKKHLKPNGKIIIAIENKFGMKYWAGCKEDHLNEFFVGIEGYQNVNRAKTFSNNELKDFLEEQNLSDYKFYYPYPDYKFATCIYSDEYLPQLGELRNNMRNFDNDRLYLFDEGKAFDNVIKSGMFPFFSNSYLVVCGEDL
ncbi:MAG: class I SAM-dependent methyltransferase [Lachnospiraceae bacterium]|nr:class I SAM-dependent methyltransferase [Lachnospiraceae bacterium]